MPLYEYKCDECSSVFEVRQKFSEEPLKLHEGCGGSVRRLLSAPALQFKGSGFYITDYTKGSGGANGKKDSGSSKSDTSSSGDSKPAAPASSTTASDKK